jgi:hypothetical protein
VFVCSFLNLLKKSSLFIYLFFFILGGFTYTFKSVRLSTSSLSVRVKFESTILIQIIQQVGELQRFGSDHVVEGWSHDHGKPGLELRAIWRIGQTLALQGFLLARSDALCHNI